MMKVCNFRILTFVVLCFVSVLAQDEPNLFREIERSEASRWSHCSAYCTSLDVLLVFGGTPDIPSRDTVLRYLDTMEAFTFESETWSLVEMTSQGSLPGKRESCGLEVLESKEGECTVGLVQSSLSDDAVQTFVGKLTKGGSGLLSLSWLKTVRTDNTRPAGRSQFCATGHQGSMYLFGGRRETATGVEARSDLWSLNMSFNLTSNEVLLDWTSLSNTNLANSPSPRYDCAMTAVSSPSGQDSQLVVHGGQTVQNPGVTIYQFSNAMFYFNLGSSAWSIAPQPSEQSVFFARRMHALTSYAGRVFAYAGYLALEGISNRVELVFPDSVLSMVPFGENPQTGCLADGKEAPAYSSLWCMYDESEYKNPSPGAAGTACAVRENEMVCTFGLNIMGNTGRILRTLRVFDLDHVSSNLVIAEEPFTGFESLVGSIYFFFALFTLLTFLVCLHGIRSNQRFAQMVGVPTQRMNRGARRSVIGRLPMVVWQGQGLPVLPFTPGDLEETNGEGVELKVMDSPRQPSGVDAELTEEEKSDLERGPKLPTTVQGGDGKEGGVDQALNVLVSGQDSGGEDEYKELCSICLAEFEPGEKLRQLPCKHLYHPECIDLWLPTNKSCPLCKQDIDKLPPSREPSMESINPSFEQREGDNSEGNGNSSEQPSRIPCWPIRRPRLPGINRSESNGGALVTSAV